MRERVEGAKTLIERNKWHGGERVTEKEKEPEVEGVPLVPRGVHARTHSHAHTQPFKHILR